MEQKNFELPSSLSSPLQRQRLLLQSGGLVLVRIWHLYNADSVVGHNVIERVGCNDDELSTALFRRDGIILEHHERDFACLLVEENVVLVHQSERTFNNVTQSHEQT